VGSLAKVSQVSERGNRLYRALDRYAGVPLVAAAGLLSRRRSLPVQIDRIAVLKTGAIGDTILVSGPLQDLRTAYPEARIVLFTSASNADAGRLLGVADEVVSTPVARPWTAARRIRSERPDVLLDFASWPRIDALLSAVAGRAFTVGFRTAGQHRHYPYDAVAEHSDVRHELDNYRALLAPLGVRATSLPRVLPRGVLSEDRYPPTPYVVLHLWAAGIRKELKEWPFERWAQLARELAGRRFTLALTGGADDVERSRAFASLCEEAGLPVINLAGLLTLDELVDLLARGSGLVSVNTGVVHIGAAASVPTVAINGPTSSRRWGPLGPHSASVDSEHTGCGYLNLGFEYAGRRTDCMDGVSVARVLARTLELLATAESDVPQTA
jgi:ADP-heptose:LPS heptosyltransferase